MAPSAAFAILSSLAVVVWVCFAIGRARAASGAALVLFGALWLGGPSVVAASGFLADFSATPPRMFFVLFAVLGAAAAFSFSAWGSAAARHYSMAALIGFHAFRFMPETLLLLAHREGLAPVQMTLEGRNFDVLSAILALAVYMVWRKSSTGVPRWAAVVWSATAFGLLVNIVGTAVLSMPTPFRMFHNDPANTFVASFPYILLPTVHVAAAIAGHLLVLRRLAR